MRILRNILMISNHEAGIEIGVTGKGGCDRIWGRAEWFTNFLRSVARKCCGAPKGHSEFAPPTNNLAPAFLPPNYVVDRRSQETASGIKRVIFVANTFDPPLTLGSHLVFEPPLEVTNVRLFAVWLSDTSVNTPTHSGFPGG